MHLCDIEAADIAMDEADIECAIARDPMEVLRAPYCRKDKFRREAVRQNPHMIKPLLDMGYGDGEKLLAIAYDATTVKHMPDEDLRVYLMAVKCNPMAVWCIPAKYRTYVLLEMVIKQNPNVIANLYKKQSCASSNHEKEQLAKLALSIDGTVLRYIPEEAKTKELCDVALAQTALAREYVPASMRA